MFKVGDKVKLVGIGVFVAHVFFGNEGENFVGTIVEFNSEDDMYLIEFPKGFKGHDGNGKSSKVYNDNNVLWFNDLAFKLVKEVQEPQKQQEEQNILDEIDKVLKRLFDELKQDDGENSSKEEFKPYILSESGKLFRGYIGKETKMVDCNNSKLYIGDIVSVEHENLGRYITYVGDDGYGRNIVVGISSHCYEDGTISEFKVTKLIDHSIAYNYLDVLCTTTKVKYILKESDED